MLSPSVLKPENLWDYYTGDFIMTVVQTLSLNYNTMLIRPHLEYAAPVWDSFTASNINKLENTQKFALKVCTKHWNLGYQDLLSFSPKLPSIF